MNHLFGQDVSELMISLVEDLLIKVSWRRQFAARINAIPADVPQKHAAMERCARRRYKRSILSWREVQTNRRQAVLSELCVSSHRSAGYRFSGMWPSCFWLLSEPVADIKSQLPLACRHDTGYPTGSFERHPNEKHIFKQ